RPCLEGHDPSIVPRASWRRKRGSRSRGSDSSPEGTRAGLSKFGIPCTGRVHRCTEQHVHSDGQNQSLRILYHGPRIAEPRRDHCSKQSDKFQGQEKTLESPVFPRGSTCNSIPCQGYPFLATC